MWSPTKENAIIINTSIFFFTPTTKISQRAKYDKTKDIHYSRVFTKKTVCSEDGWKSLQNSFKKSQISYLWPPVRKIPNEDKFHDSSCCSWNLCRTTDLQFAMDVQRHLSRNAFGRIGWSAKTLLCAGAALVVTLVHIFATPVPLKSAQPRCAALRYMYYDRLIFRAV